MQLRAVRYGQLQLALKFVACNVQLDQWMWAKVGFAVTWRMSAQGLWLAQQEAAALFWATWCQGLQGQSGHAVSAAGNGAALL